MEEYNQKILFKRIDDLELSGKLATILDHERIFYIGQLVHKTEGEMLRCINLGKKSLNDLKVILAKMNLSFGMEINGWNVENVNKYISEVKPEEKIKNDFWSLTKNNLSSIVNIRSLRKMKLQEHQQIIDNYCKKSKSPFQRRNILIYDIIIVQKKKSKDANKELKINNSIEKIKTIINKGFYKDLLKYLDLNEDNRRIHYKWKI